MVEALPSEPPSEFRLFRAGVNHTQKGAFLFDDDAAAQVMAAWQEWGVDLTIDLNHDSLDLHAMHARSDASDARGWFQLELRAGELWAINVTWTPDGERRLREKTQRYTSPAFNVDEHERIIEVVNCAICAMPATNRCAPLVAARRLNLLALDAPRYARFAVAARAASFKASARRAAAKSL